MHPRRAIREAFKTRLLNATAAEDRVFATMTPPLEVETMLHEEGPAIMVYARQEAKPELPVTRNEGGQRRTLTIEIEAVLVGASDLDNKLDDMAEAIENLFENWSVPGFPAAEVELGETHIYATDSKERYLGGIFMVYEVRYWKVYREEVEVDFDPHCVFAVAKNENGIPPGYSGPLPVPGEDIIEAKELGWRPGYLVASDGDCE